MARASSARQGHDGPIEAGRAYGFDIFGDLSLTTSCLPHKNFAGNLSAPSERGLSRWEKRSPTRVIEISERPNRLSYSVQ
jgi:hypothetical protein